MNKSLKYYAELLEYPFFDTACVRQLCDMADALRALPKPEKKARNVDPYKKFRFIGRDQGYLMRSDHQKPRLLRTLLHSLDYDRQHKLDTVWSEPELNVLLSKAGLPLPWSKYGVNYTKSSPPVLVKSEEGFGLHPEVKKWWAV